MTKEFSIIASLNEFGYHHPKIFFRLYILEKNSFNFA